MHLEWWALYTYQWARGAGLQPPCWLGLFFPYIVTEQLPRVAPVLYWDTACTADKVLAFIEFIF